MPTYVALLRGINVGGKNLIRMPALKACFEENGFEDVATYIQSGNVLFSVLRDAERRADRPDRGDARRHVRLRADRGGAEPAGRCGRSSPRAPKGFGTQPATYRYDVIFLKEPLTAKTAIKAVPTNPVVDASHAGTGVLYFSRLTAKATAEPPEQDRLVADLRERDDPELEHDDQAAFADGRALLTSLGHRGLARLAVAWASRVRTTFFTRAVGRGSSYSNLIVPLPVTRDPSSSRWTSIASEPMGKKL